MKKKFLAMLLCTVMLAGCQMTDSTEGGDISAGESEEVVAENSQDTAETTTASDAVELDLYLDFTWFPTDSWTGIIPETLTENGGVYFNVTRSADDSQLGLMIASGDLPDVIWTDKEIDRLCDSNLCYSYDELIQEYGLDWEPTADRIGIAKSHNADENDEHYYTILQNYSTNEEWSQVEGATPNISCLYYRKDIWEELGEPKLETLEDVINVCKMVKEQYPDMIPINAGSPGWRLGAFRDYFGGGNEFLYVEDGTVAYRDTTADFYDYLVYVNRLYREGLITEENLAITVEDDAMQQAYSGKNFILEYLARPTHLAQLNTYTKNIVGEEAEWAAIPIPDEARTIVRANAGWAGVFISKNCKDPEAAIRMIAYMSSEEGRRLALWGREGIDYELDENGVPQFSEEWQETYADGDKMTAVYNPNYYMCTYELDEALSYYSGVDEDIVANFTKNMDKVVNYPELTIALPVSTSDMEIIRAKITEAREAELVKIYTAESDEAFEEAYQNYMSLLDQIGVQELNAYMTEEVAVVKEEFGF